MVSNFVETTDWVKIAHKLRRHNRDLVKTVVHLEQALAESQERLQRQIQQLFNASPERRASDRSDLAPDQDFELHTGYAWMPELAEVSKEQAACLLKEIETSYQAIQRQQIVIETLSKQLEASQERVAQLERECALLSEEHSEQTHKLMMTQEQAQELQVRLHRQQRYALQYKAALNQFPSAQATSDRQSPPSFSSLPAKVQSIQPWSAPATKANCALNLKLSLHGHAASGGTLSDSSSSAKSASKSAASPSYLLSSAKKRQSKVVELPRFLHC